MLLSIVIPTKNRQRYCVAAVKQIVSLNLHDTQIIVQDNSDICSLKNELKDFIENKKVKYHYREGVISFVDNFSEAVSLCDGEYVCMIGDDDGILSNIEVVAASARERDLDCVIAGLNAVYIWPSEAPIVKGGENGFLNLSYIKKKEVKVDAREGLKQLVKHAGQDYQQLDLPRVYHGIAKRTKLDEVKNIAGNYFKGLTPDIFIAVALASVCTNIVRIFYPVTISGICPRSGSSDSATGKHTGELKDAPHFKGHEHYEWDKKSPAIYSVESIWAETALQALNTFHHNKLYGEFNVGLLDAICLKRYPQFSKIIIKHANRNNVCVFYWNLMLQIKFLFSYLRRAYKRLINLKFNVKKYYEVKDIDQAARITDLELKKLSK